MMNGRGSISTAGPNPAASNVRIAEFRFGCAPTSPGAAATAPGFLSRRFSARALSPTSRSAQYPHAATTIAAVWRNPAGRSEPGLLYLERPRTESPRRHFCSESIAQELTLRPRAPGLPHQRHPMTADEALAGIALALLIVSAVIYGLARWFA